MPADFSSLPNELLYQIVADVFLLEPQPGVVNVVLADKSFANMKLEPIFFVSALLRYIAHEVWLTVKLDQQGVVRLG